MEKETDFYHLFTQHQAVIFVVGSLFIVTFLLATGVFLSKRAESKRRQEGDASEHETLSMLTIAINNEIDLADTLAKTGNYHSAFHHLERAHVLGQASTFHHTRIHWRMLKVGFKLNSPREVLGQILRIVGASTKTPFGIYPKGNTGGANVWFFKSMPIPSDLQTTIDQNP
jgi:hypothetical protein